MNVFNNDFFQRCCCLFHEAIVSVRCMHKIEQKRTRMVLEKKKRAFRCHEHMFQYEANTEKKSEMELFLADFGFAYHLNKISTLKRRTNKFNIQLSLSLFLFKSTQNDE